MATLVYDDTGNGRPVVFLHGITADRAHWRPVIERLEDRYRCINVDLLGHGGSPDGESADLFGQVAALGALLAELEVEDPVLVGHSFGGFVATFAATAGGIAGVLNIDQAFDTVEFRERIVPLADQLRSDDFAAAFTHYVQTYDRPELVPDEHRHLVEAEVTRARPVLDAWIPVLDTPPGDLIAQVEVGLTAVDAAYLAVFGDPVSDRERELQGLIPNGTVEVWDDHGHFVHLVAPDRLAARIAEFVDGLG